MHQTLLTIQICSYPGALNDESHSTINWRRVADCLSLAWVMPPKQYIKAGVVKYSCTCPRIGEMPPKKGCKKKNFSSSEIDVLLNKLKQSTTSSSM